MTRNRANSDQRYGHRDGDPASEFSYDNLDRLARADYGIDDTNEIFTMDDLGNRDTVNLRSGSDVNYVVDVLTNRYTAVGSNSLSYDSAGNLTRDKDGYEYQYDYENRIVKITKDGNDIAEFAYDALGRRIRKIDSVASKTTLYYNNPDWQVLCEYDGSGNLQRSFIYGNYIDEVLRMSISDGSNYYYLHNHLYSPVALTDDTGAVLERYEYDAYGQPTILDTGYQILDTVQYGNPYLFTGRRLDILDNGSLKIQYNRNRYYDYHIGRWLTQDPLGITPNPQKPNRFDALRQYEDGLNLYEYAKSNSLVNLDPDGLIPWTPGGAGFPGPILGIPSSGRSLGTRSGEKSGKYVGGEVHFFVGYGRTVVFCTDECGYKHQFLFRKVCFGGALGASIGGGLVRGIDGKKCKPETYEKWFYEAGLTVPTGAIGRVTVGVDVGYDDYNWGLPGWPTGVVEGGIFPGYGFKVKSTWCKYTYLRDQTRNYGYCGCW